MPEAPLPTVSVVVPTSGKRAVLDEALAAALADPATTDLVVVLDEAEPSAEGERIMERVRALDPRVRTMRTPTGGEDLLTLQIARDSGAEFATGEVVLSLDDDVILEPGAVSGHARAHQGEEKLLVLGYMPVVTAEPWPRSSATIRFYASAYEHSCDLYEADPRRILTHLWGGNFSIRREDWLRSLRRPRLKCWGHDDQELGLLFLREGVSSRIDRGLRGGHLYRRSLDSFIERAARSIPGQAKLRAANPDLLPEPPSAPPTRRDQISGPFLSLSRSAPGWWAVRTGLKGLIVVAAALKAHRIEDAAARFLWFLASERSRRQLAAAAA